MNLNLTFAKSMNLNLNFDFSKSINLNLVFLKSMNLNLIFSKSMNLNLKIKKKMNGSNPGRDISAPKEKQPFHLRSRSRGASTGHQTASDANCWTICALLIAIMLKGICSPAPA